MVDLRLQRLISEREMESRGEIPGRGQYKGRRR